MTFIDRTMIQLATSALGVAADAEKRKPTKQRNQGAIDGFSAIKNFMELVPLPSAFALRTESQVNVVGTLKDLGMEEPISAHYFKHGNAGLSGVYLVGIKEVPTPVTDAQAPSLLSAANQTAEALSGMLFPPDAVRVTPIAMFREI